MLFIPNGVRILTRHIPPDTRTRSPSLSCIGRICLGICGFSHLKISFKFSEGPFLLIISTIFNFT